MDIFEAIILDTVISSYISGLVCRTPVRVTSCPPCSPVLLSFTFSNYLNVFHVSLDVLLFFLTGCALFDSLFVFYCGCK